MRLAGHRVWIAGHRGMVGQALVRRLASEDCELITASRDVVDLRRQSDTEEWMAANRPQLVFLAAATVGGIAANDSRPAEFIYDNLAIQTNIIDAARRVGVTKLLALGSSCIYPRLAEQPMREDSLLTGPLEPTNQWYALAKIAGIKLCQAYRRQYGLDMIAAMPTNLYGMDDNFELESSHVLPALIRKIHEAKTNGSASVDVWGTGNARREFMYVDDCADALVFLMKNYSGHEHVNVGTGRDVSIKEACEVVARVIGYTGTFHFDTSKPDGAPRRQLDVSRLQGLGWTAKTTLDQGLRFTYDWFCQIVAQCHQAS